MVNKAFLDVAVTLEIGVRYPKVCGIRGIRGDACRDGTTREEPHLDEVVGPLHSIDATGTCVEAVAVRVRFNSVHIASCCTRRAIERAIVKNLGTGLSQTFRLRKVSMNQSQCTLQVTLQSVSVCSTNLLFVFRLTPSMISISPGCYQYAPFPRVEISYQYLATLRRLQIPNSRKLATDIVSIRVALACLPIGYLQFHMCWRAYA